MTAIILDPGEVYNPVGVPGLSREDFGVENSEPLYQKCSEKWAYCGSGIVSGAYLFPRGPAFLGKNCKNWNAHGVIPTYRVTPSPWRGGFLNCVTSNRISEGNLLVSLVHE
jgi:hypothetical protein